MQITYVVHGVAQGPTRVPAIVEGVETHAVVDCVNVELTPDLPRHGTVQLNFIAGERALAAEMFEPDAKIRITLERIDE